MRDATPRLNVEGPLIPGKLYFSEGLEYEARKIEVYTLPFPRNQKVTEGVNSFAQLDWVVSGKQLVTATAHIAPQRLSYVNLDYFNPQPTVPDAATHNYTATIADRLTLWGGLLENIFSATRFDAGVWRQGNQDLTVAPWGNSGNYFAQQSRTAVRYGWSPVYSFALLQSARRAHFQDGRRRDQQLRAGPGERSAREHRGRAKPSVGDGSRSPAASRSR